MTEQDRLTLEAYISTRLHLSWERLKETPAYQKQSRVAKEQATIAEAMMEQKLDRQEQSLVQDHMVEELELAYQEQIEAYLQGLRDCVPLLTFLGLLRPGLL